MSSTETILLSVTGMSPAVLTETVWALAQETPAVVPHRVIVVTTSAGAREIRRQLFEPLERFAGATAWETLRSALGAQGLDLANRLRFGTTGSDLRIITAPNPVTHCSSELADIRSPADNEATADFLLEQVRSVVENPDTQLIASIAGGRKTMGALLYACMTLIGRETDRLTHVLVSEPFDTLRDFFFPTQPGASLCDRSGASVAPAAARVDLADVPFVPLRNLFRRELGQPAGSFGRLIDVCRANVRLTVGENLRFEIDFRHPRCWINGALLGLSPREHFVLLFFAQRAKQGDTVLSAYDECLVELNEFRKQVRKTAPPNDFSDWRHSDSLSSEIDERDLTRLLSDVRRKTKKIGGDASYLSAVLPSKGRCALDIPPSLIHIKNQPTSTDLPLPA
jgi:CRISPR-associated protein (TIGR02584 family)